MNDDLLAINGIEPSRRVSSLLEGHTRRQKKPNQVKFKFIVHQIHREKEKTKTQSSIKKINSNLEYWLGNIEKLESAQVEVLSRLFSLGK